jgi:hypothetical protein
MPHLGHVLVIRRENSRAAVSNTKGTKSVVLFYMQRSDVP